MNFSFGFAKEVFTVKRGGEKKISSIKHLPCKTEIEEF